MQYRITPKQEAILKALASYKYLSVYQLMYIGIAHDRSYLNKQLRMLKAFPKPLIYSQHFGVDPKKGKLESIHALTKYGAKFLAEECSFEKTIKYCTHQKQVLASQYHHRKHTIDIQLAISGHCSTQGIALDIYYNYFEKVSTGKQHGYRSLCSFPYNPSGDYLEADALLVTGYKEVAKVYAIEFFNDDKVARVLQKLVRYRQALILGNPSQLFGVNSNTHVLLVFRKANMVELVQKRIIDDSKRTAFLPYFHWLILEEVLYGRGLDFIGR